MSVEKGERHGGHSSSICSEFLKQNSLHASDYQDVLEAIKHHDDKDYGATPVENKIFYILTAADDLDAFGTDGAERYLEIYRLRGIQEDKINEKIIANALNRFRNFELNYSLFPDLISKHKRRYEALVCYLNNNPT